MCYKNNKLYHAKSGTAFLNSGFYFLNEIILKSFSGEFHTNLEAERETFKNYLSKQLDDPACGGLDLRSRLIMPIQRVPRYL